MSEKKTLISAYKVSGRFDIGNLLEYRNTLSYFASSWKKQVSSLPKDVSETCPARIGLMGNPSDGFHGKTLSFLLKNFSAIVTIREQPVTVCCDGDVNCFEVPKLNDISRDVIIIPHPTLDPGSFHGIDQLQLHTTYNGYYGGVRLLQATCKAFADHCIRAGIIIHLQRGFIISYDTNIPRMVGLSGSSALVVATFRGLMKYFGVTLEDLKIEKQGKKEVEIMSIYHIV